MRVTEMGIIGPSGITGVGGGAGGGHVSTGLSHSIYSPPPPTVAEPAMPPIYEGAVFLGLAALAYYYASSRGMFGLGKSKNKGELIPQIDAGAVRAKPKKVDVKVERGGAEEATLEVSTKGLSSVAELGERLAEQMVTELDIEDAFKLYYLDNEGDTMLVSAHTGLRDLLYSELITARVDEAALPEPAPPPSADEKKKKKKKEPAAKKLPPPRSAPQWD